MSPSFTRGKRGQAYRYYVSAPLQQGRRDPGDTGLRRVPGPALEAKLSAIIRRVAPASAVDPLSALARVEVTANSLQLLMPVGLMTTVRSRIEPGETLEPDPADSAFLRLTIPVRMRLRGGRSWILGATKPAPRRDPVLIKALRAAHALLRMDSVDLPTLDAAPASPYHRRLVRLALLAPELQRAILAGNQPPGLTLESLMRAPIPALWSAQKAMVEALALTGTSETARHRHG